MLVLLVLFWALLPLPKSSKTFSYPCRACCRVAEACVATLQEMNPFVKVAALPGTPAAALAAETLRQCDLLLLCGQPADVIAQADALCREDGVAFYAGVCRGIFGWAFADLQEHKFVVEVRLVWCVAVGALLCVLFVSVCLCPAVCARRLAASRAALLRLRFGKGLASLTLRGAAPFSLLCAVAAEARGAGRRHHHQNGGGEDRQLCQLAGGYQLQPGGRQHEAPQQALPAGQRWVPLGG